MLAPQIGYTFTHDTLLELDYDLNVYGPDSEPPRATMVITNVEDGVVYYAYPNTRGANKREGSHQMRIETFNQKFQHTLKNPNQKPFFLV